MGRVRARAGGLPRARGRPARGAWAATRSGPHPPPTRCCRCWPRTPAYEHRYRLGWTPTVRASSPRKAPRAPRAPRRALERRLLAARVRARPVPGAAIGGGRSAGDVRGADQASRLGRARAPASARGRVGRGARADRPRHHLTRVERRRLPGARELPRLPPPHDPPPPTPGPTTAAPTTTSSRSVLARGHAREFVAHTLERLRAANEGRRGPAARRRAGRVRARHRAARALVVRGRGVAARRRRGVLRGRDCGWYASTKPKRCATPLRWRTPNGSRARGARAATSRPGRARRWPTSPSPPERPS